MQMLRVYVVLFNLHANVGSDAAWSSVSSTASGSPRGADIESGSLLRQRRRRSYLRGQRIVGLLVQSANFGILLL